MCARKAHQAQDLRQPAPAVAVRTAATIVTARLREAHHRAEATTAAAHPQEAARQAQAAVQAAATAAAVAAQAAVTPVQAAIVQAVAADAARVAVAATAQAEEDKKKHIKSDKKTTFAAKLQGSLFLCHEEKHHTPTHTSIGRDILRPKHRRCLPLLANPIPRHIQRPRHG